MDRTKALPGFGGPAASTEAPLEMLAACHGRVQKQCETLERLPPHVAGHGADEPARQAATAVMRYFDTAAVDHHADEEENLFPELSQVSQGEDKAPGLAALIQVLCAEHRQLEARWQVLRGALAALAAGDASRLSPSLVSDFVGAYRRHIDCEDRVLLPLAQRVLDGASLHRVGEAMRERRGIPPVR
jgi:hemerythrin-like domain-containing protein